MIKAGSIAKGMFLLMKNEPYEVSEREFVNPGKGSAFVRLKLKNCKTGLVIRQVIKTQESVEEIEIDTRDVQYLYFDGGSYVFMDSESFEQMQIPGDLLEDKKYYLIEGSHYQVQMRDSEPIEILVPNKIKLSIEEAEYATKGDTVTGGTKIVVTGTGLKVKVPLFIKAGDDILVNTETGEYVERVS